MIVALLVLWLLVSLGLAVTATEEPPAVDTARTAYPLWPKQLQAMALLWEFGVNQLLYGGAAGGGKSYFLRAAAYTMAMMWPGCRIGFFRLTSGELMITQVEPFLLEMAELGYDIDKCWRASRSEFKFPNGSIINFLHIDQSLGAKKWLSAEFAAILIDEAVTFAPKDLALLYSRVRRPKNVLTAAWKNWRPMCVFATNPGGNSHSYLKENFYDLGHLTPGVRWVAKAGPKTVNRAYLPAVLGDNPSIDPDEYLASLYLLPEEERKQMLDGNWSWFKGKAIPQLDPDIHLVRREWFAGTNDWGEPLMPNRDWRRIIGLDHGLQAPTAVSWTCEDNDGNFIVYQCHYEAQKPVQHHVDAIKHRMQLDHGRLGVLIRFDPQMDRIDKSWGTHKWSLVDEYRFEGNPYSDEWKRVSTGLRLDRCDDNRDFGLSVLKRLLEPDSRRMFPDWHPKRGEMGAPRLYITTDCEVGWVELNNLQLVEPKDGVFKSDDVAKKDDHFYDSMRFGIPYMERYGAKGGRSKRGRQLV